MPPVAVAGGAKERHRRAGRPDVGSSATPVVALEARKALPKTKFHSYFEFVENKDKRKKKLDFTVKPSWDGIAAFF